MAQFLWIEDFENNPAATAHTVFGPLLAGLALEESEEAIRETLRKYGIFVELTFLEALRFIRNPAKLARIDYIVLDIDLEPKGRLTDKDNLLPDILRFYGYDASTPKELESRKAAELALKKVAGYQ